jgi:xanthine/uracil permease
MDEKPQFVLPERNPQTHAAHRRDVLRQITLPLVIGSLLLVAGMALVIIAAAGASGEVRRWADISLVWLILPALFFSLLILGLLTGITYLVSKLLGVLPGYARLVQDGYTTLTGKVMRLSDALVLPLLKLKGWAAAARKARQVATQLITPGPRQED